MLRPERPDAVLDPEGDRGTSWAFDMILDVAADGTARSVEVRGRSRGPLPAAPAPASA